MDNTIIVPIDGTDYQLRTRLKHGLNKRISDLGWRMSVDGKSLSEGDDLADMKRVDLEGNSERQDKARLEARLVGVNRRDIEDLSSTHVAVLIREIVALEDQEEEEIEAFLAAHPSEIPSDE